MATVNDFIKTYVDINQLLVQKQQLALAEENARIARLQAVQGVAQNLSDRGALDPLSQLFGSSSGDAGAASAVIHGTAPGAGVTQRGLISQGVDAFTPEERARLASEAATRDATGVGRYQLQTEDFLSQLLGPHDINDAMRQRLGEQLRTRTATGMNTAQLAGAEAAAALPAGDQTEGARVGMGIAPNAGDVLQATTQAAGIRAQETGQGLQYAQGQDELNFRKWLVGQGLDTSGNPPSTDPNSATNPKFLATLISDNAQILATKPDLPQANAELLQRQIFSAIMAGKGTVLDPYRDIPSPRKPGESTEAYQKRASEEMANLMTTVTGRPMNPRTLLGWLQGYLPGGGR